MGRSSTCLGIGAALVALAATSAVPAAAEGVPSHRVPPPVLDAVRARFGDARIVGVSREREEGRLVYEVAITSGGRAFDVSVTPAGAIVLIEREIRVADLPGPVARALDARYPAARWKAAEEAIRVRGAREELTHYAVLLVTARGRMLEALVHADGTILAEEPAVLGPGR